VYSQQKLGDSKYLSCIFGELEREHRSKLSKKVTSPWALLAAQLSSPQQCNSGRARESGAVKELRTMET